ncbi:MAG: FtsX-like permease family protein [Pseudolysinimonas sp.]
MSARTESTRDNVRWGASRLVMRRLLTRPAASLLVAALVLVTALIAAVVPRLVEQQATAELAYQLAAIGPEGQTLQGSVAFPEFWNPTPPPQLGQIYGGLQSTFTETRDSLPQPLRRIVGAPRWIVQTPVVQGSHVDGVSRLVGLQLTAAQDYLSRIHVVQGTAPTPWSTSDTEPSQVTVAIPIDVVLSVKSAAQLKVVPGDVVTAAGSEPQQYRVTGLFEPIDPNDVYWALNSQLLAATPAQSDTNLPYLAASAFVDPLSVGRLTDTFRNAQLSLYYPISTAGIEGADAATLRSQLAATVAAGISLPNTVSTLPLQTDVTHAVQTAVQRGAVLAGLLALLAAAPLGVVLAVLMLGVQAVVRGRRTDLLLAAARGASPWQLRGVMALEGALLSIPTVLVVTVLSTVLIPGSFEPANLLFPLLVAVTPPILFAALAVTGTGRGVLASAVAQLRGFVEIAIILLAVVSLFLLVHRGLAQASAAVGVDPLLSVAPLLLAVSVGIVVVRGYPIPMRATRRAAVRARGLPAFIGSIRATRAPTVGLAGVLALVVGISVSLFSAVLLTTIDAGIATAASETVGADARVDGPTLTPAQRNAVARVDGVRAVAGIQYFGPLTVTQAPVDDSVTLLLAQTRELGSLRTIPAGLRTLVDGRVPVVASSDLFARLGADRTATIDNVKVRVVGSLPAESRLGPQQKWLMVDQAFASRFSTTFAPSVLLIKTDAASPPQLQQLLEHAVGADSAAAKADGTTTVMTVVEATAARQLEPVVNGVQVGLILGAGLAVLLCGIALVLSTVAAGVDRARTTGILRTLGMPRRKLSALIAWELVPVAVVALVAGALLGIALPFIVTAAVDLRPYTGSEARLIPVFDPLLIFGVLCAFSVVVVASGLVAIAVDRRLNPSTTLRMGA